MKATTSLSCRLFFGAALMMGALMTSHPKAEAQNAPAPRAGARLDIPLLNRRNVPGEVGRIAEDLKNGNLETRRNAAQALLGMDGEEVAAAFKQAVGDEDLDVSRWAAEALACRGDWSGMKALLPELRSEVYWNSSTAAKALHWLAHEFDAWPTDTGDSGMTEALREAAKDRSAFFMARVDATLVLAKMRDPDAVRQLVHYLRFGSDIERENAARALGNFQGEVREALTETMKHDTCDWIQNYAAASLSRMGDEGGWRKLIGDLKSDNYVLRQCAVRGLAELGGKRAEAGLREAMKDNNYYVSFIAAGALAERGDKRAWRKLIKALKSNNWQKRFCAVVTIGEALVKTSNREAETGLRQSIGDPNSEVRGRAIENLARMGDSAALRILMKDLTDKTGFGRMGAAQIFGEIRYGKAKAALREALMDETRVAVQDAAVSLAQIGDLDGLIQEMDNPNPYIRWCVVDAIDMIRGRQSNEALRKAMQDPAPRVCLQAAQSLADRGDDTGLQTMMDSLKSADSEVRRDAAFAMIGRKGEKARRALREALGKGDWYTADPLVVALTRLGDEQWLSDHYKSQNADVRHEIARAFQWAGSPTAVKILKQAIADTETEISLFAVEMLAKVGDRDALDKLLECLKSGNPDIRLEGVYLLGRYGGAEAIPILEKVNGSQEIADAATRAIEEIKKRAKKSR